MEFKGTKGKWRRLSIDTKRCWINVTSDNGVIARSFYGDEEPIVNKKEAEANAKLIACAPEFLEDEFLDIKTLEQWICDLEMNNLTQVMIEQMKDRISFKLELIKRATE